MTTNKLAIFESLAEAWRRVSGSKAQIWSAYALVLGVATTAGFLIGLLDSMLPGAKVLMVIAYAVVLWLNLGIILIAIKRTRNENPPLETVFYPLELSNIFKLLGTYFLKFTIYMPAIILFLLPHLILGQGIKDGTNIIQLAVATTYVVAICYFIYFAVRLMFTSAFLLDKNLGVINSIKSSFKATAGNFWRIFIYHIILLISCACLFPMEFILHHLEYAKNIPLLIGALLLIIPAIWFLPFFYLGNGVLYQRLAPQN